MLFSTSGDRSFSGLNEALGSREKAWIAVFCGYRPRSKPRLALSASKKY